jgi:hypothetical protein
MVSAALFMSASCTASTKLGSAELLGGDELWQAGKAFAADEHYLATQAQLVSGGQEDGISEIPDRRCRNAQELEAPPEKSQDAHAGFH